MGITKTAGDRDRFVRPCSLFPNARGAFQAFLQSLQFQQGEQVLLPAYIGWSSREGSGVFDPVTNLKLDFAFYRLNTKLQIDLEDLTSKLKTGRIKLVVLIHYFGYVDPSYTAAVEIARKYGAWVLEDEAHALLTDRIGGIAGRLGDACIYSLHKMLPVSGGGMLVTTLANRNLVQTGHNESDQEQSLGEYDLFAVAQKRRRNAIHLAQSLSHLQEHVVPLWEDLQPGEFPQTFPVLILRANRDELYTKLNAAGFGVVSLYHTMIQEIGKDAYPASHAISRKILNLPVHQDVETDQLDQLVSELKKTLLVSA
ncbi:MAG TPA: DegT/DnrJ/EryC1/StrS family aminotransferase [Schlesneria sp.]|jgi:dTDP-4-amino-4,6-dideoxygalactose transaminase